jgi:hypothetical protein
MKLIAPFSLYALLGCSTLFAAEAPADARRAFAQLSWSTDATQPARFIAVHGRRSAMFGYAEQGLEGWAYPVQILRSFGVAFRRQGDSTEIDGQSVLRRIVYSPEAVTRIYVGPDFVVRERLFVPLDAPGAIVTYEMDGARPVDIVVRFVPVLNLMWPAAIGGQEAQWDPGASAYLLSEPSHRFTASVGSPDIVAHDDTLNYAQSVGRSPGLAFTIRARSARNTAQVVIAGGVAGGDASAIAKSLLKESMALERAAVDHYVHVLDKALQIDTPDPDASRALAWSEIALDQAWVCNPDLGCGLVAGYGASRKARRPQYDWFFAGDGMVAVSALLAAGQYERAHEELEFILKFQDRKNGMIWHELSQSAALLDWDKYPYKYVHVDLTFDFLNTVNSYLSATADVAFVNKNWDALQAAYRYCRSLLDPKDGLPRIPPDKEGSREQDALNDDLTLSASWVAGAQAFADLAAATGHMADAEAARRTSQQAREAVGHRYWDRRQQVWISGYSRSGAPLIDRDARPAAALRSFVFTPQQRASLLDQLASYDFQADWGTRGTASSAGTYEPNSYGSGSVWALGTAATASAFWAEHRPATALPIWGALVPWTSLDSLGHMPETLAGDYYHEELESVPEQTWSSAAFFTTTVSGLLGLHVDSRLQQVSFAPHLPPSWNEVTVRHLRVGGSEITLNMTQSADEIRLQMQNAGAPVQMVFDPELPFGATLRGVQIGNRSINAKLEQNPQDTHAKVDFTLPAGSTLLTLDYRGGIAIVAPSWRPAIGEPSGAIKITALSLSGRVLVIELDHLISASSSFELRTPWVIKDIQGAALEPVGPSVYRVTLSARTRDAEPHSYQRSKVILRFTDSD